MTGVVPVVIHVVNNRRQRFEAYPWAEISHTLRPNVQPQAAAGHLCCRYDWNDTSSKQNREVGVRGRCASQFRMWFSHTPFGKP